MSLIFDESAIESFLDAVCFDADGLVPAIAQDYESKAVLMLAYQNREALEITLRSGRVTYFSRSRQELWEKGLTSGNVQALVGIAHDCDADTILLSVEQQGPACHTGTRSCFDTRWLSA
ncbi:MAG: phosphoribosyl-AMP cyclohydrolase [Microbacteriaceae bacterium]